MFNRSEILTKAWAEYRLSRPVFFVAGDTADKRKFLPSLFAKMLRKVWAEAKKQANAERVRAAEQEAARQLVERLHAGRVAQFAGMSASQRSARLSGLKDELQLLDYAPWGVRVADRRSDLTEELNALLEADEATVSPMALVA